MKLKAIILCMGVVGCLIFTGCGKSTSFSRNNHLALNDSNYFETRGLNFFVFSNLYDATFDDSKISAVEIIHHGIRTAYQRRRPHESDTQTMGQVTKVRRAYTG